MCVFHTTQLGYSFLHISAANGHTDICSFLIEKGVNIHQVTEVSIVFHYSCIITDIGYIPRVRDVRPVISCGKEQCLTEAEESTPIS